MDLSCFRLGRDGLNVSPHAIGIVRMAYSHNKLRLFRHQTQTNVQDRQKSPASSTSRPNDIADLPISYWTHPDRVVKEGAFKDLPITTAPLIAPFYTNRTIRTSLASRQGYLCGVSCRIRGRSPTSGMSLCYTGKVELIPDEALISYAILSILNRHVLKYRPISDDLLSRSLIISLNILRVLITFPPA